MSNNNHIISLFDLGDNPNTMLNSWHKIKKQNTHIIIKEFPQIDCNQTIQNSSKDVLEQVIEFYQCIDKRKKELAREKQAEGILKAKKRGIKLGRRPLEIPNSLPEIYEQILTKKITLNKGAEILDVDYKTLKKWIRIKYPNYKRRK